MNLHFVQGKILVTPGVPADILNGTLAAAGFVQVDESTPRKAICIADPGDPRWHGSFSVIGASDPEGNPSPDDITPDLQELVDLLGGECGYTGELTVEGMDDDAKWRLRVLHRPAKGDNPARLEVVEEDSVLIYLADFAAGEQPDPYITTAVVSGIGPYAAALASRFGPEGIEAALQTLAELWTGCDRDQDLSRRQHNIASTVADLTKTINDDDVES